MKRQPLGLTAILSTVNCWWLVCLCCCLLASSVQAQATEQAEAIKPDSVVVQDTIQVADSTRLADDLKSKVKYSATDSIIYDLDGKRIFLYGKASIFYEDIQLHADFIEINYEKREVYAHGRPDSSGVIQGKPDFQQAAEAFKADSIRYNFDSKRGKIAEISTQDGDSHVHGETVKKEADNTTFISKGYYTTCELPHPHYFIYSQKIKVIPGNKIVTGPANMFVADVPTPLAIPFGFFPTRKDRSSGILFPAYGESNQLGFFLQNGGYYFGLSDFWDLALTGDIYSRGSWRANAFSNYAKRYHFNGNLSVNYSMTKTSQKELPDYAVEKGFFIRWSHMQDPKARPNSTFSANVNAGSSSFYRNNLSSAANYLTNTFNSSISYSKTWAGKPYSFSSGLSHTQNTATRDISLNLPTANFAVARITPFKRKEQVGSVKWYEKIGVSYNSTFQNSISTKDSLLFKEESLDQLRYGLQHSIPVSTSFTAAKYFTISPSFSYNERWYLKTIEKNYDAASKSAVIDTVNGFKAARDFSFATAVNTRIYGMMQFRRGPIAAIRHVITPNVGFSWRPDFAESRWGNYKEYQSDSLGTISKYSIYEGSVFGGPGSGKSSLLTFSLDNNLEMKTRHQTDTAEVTKKIKILESLSASGSYNFAADSMRLSLISVSARTQLFERLNLSFSGTFDPYVISAAGVRTKEYLWDQSGKIARFNSGNLSADFNLRHKKKTYSSDKDRLGEVDQINANPNDYLDLTIPFNLALRYNLNYARQYNAPDAITQTLGFNGDIQLSESWKITFSSGYDFTNKDLSYTSLGFFRDLHCWEMHLNWIPLGFQQSFFFQINVKSSVLQDLKLIKKNDRFDRR